MDIIIGGGITGISYAKFTKNDYLVLEQENEVGGYCRTIKRNNFVWDYSGHFFHFQHPEIEKIVCEHIDDKTLCEVEKHTQIIYKDKYIDFPFQKNIHQLDKEEFIDCLYDLFSKSEQDNPSSFKEMVYNSLGKSISEKFLIPYNEKLYACDLDKLDMNAMGRFFPKASKEDIILNFRNQDSNSYNSFFKYPKGGAIEYVNSLMKGIDSNSVFLNEEVISIDPIKKEVQTTTRTLKYDNLVSTLPFPKLLDMLNFEYIKEDFSYNKVLVLNLGFDSKGKDEKNSWVYIPSKDYCFYRVGYYDNIISSDRMSLYVELGFPGNAVLEDFDIYKERVMSDLLRIGIVNEEQKLVDYEILLMDPAYVHINKKSIMAIEDYKNKLSKYDIYSIGRYGSWTYCSIEDNIIEAKNLASKLNYNKSSI